MADFGNIIRYAALSSVAIAGLAATPLAAQNTATDQNAENSYDDNTIIVSARRRDERLLDVPVAVSAFSSEELKNLEASDLGGLQGAVPNVNLVQGRGSASSANFFIRGVGQPDALQTFDPAVGVYVDGVFLSRIQGALLGLSDVERVEVLRGPQGTLYGKNTIGGAVNVISKKPDLGQFRGEATIAYGRFDQITGTGYLSAPIVQDVAGLSVAGIYDKRDGIVTDPLTGKKYNDRDTLAGRAILRLEPNDSLDISLAGDYTRQRNALTLGYATTTLTSANSVAAFPYGPYDYKASTSFSNGEGQKLDHWGVSLTANLELSPALTLTSISAYRDLNTDFYIDIDATEVEVGDEFVGTDQRQWSQELQLKYDSDRLAGVFGLYYLDEKVTSHQEAYADDLFPFTTFTRLIDDKQRTKSFAVYGQFTYDFTDQLAFTGGLRYSKDKRRYNRFTTTVSSFGAINGLNFTFPNDLPAPLNSIDEVSFDAWTPTATLSFKPSPDTLLYLTASRGYKSGGFNGRANSLADLTLIVDGVPALVTNFKPETVWTYEAGAKGSFLDGAVKLSGAAFYTDYKDFQARVGGGSGSSVGTGVFPVLNAGKLEIYGFEFEAIVQPSTPLILSASVGYLHSEYKEFNDGRRVPPQTFSCNPTGTQIICEPAFSPPLTLRVGADYKIPIGDSAGLSFGGDMRFVDKHFLSVDNRAGLIEDGYWLGNAYVQADFGDGRYFLRGAVKNITDTLYKTDGQEFSSVGNIQTVYYGDPRTWTVTAGVKF